MIGTILSYVLLGVSLSAPVGPINVTQFNKGIKFGFFHAWFTGLGGMLADIIMMFIIFFGLANYLTYPIPQLIMFTLGFVILLYIGYGSIKGAFSPILLNEIPQKREPLLKSLFHGFLIAISNPFNIIFWIGIYGSILAESLNTISNQEALLYSSAIFIGISLWDLTMATIAHFTRKKINRKVLKWISIIAGMVLIGFGIYFGFQAIVNLIDLL